MSRIFLRGFRVVIRALIVGSIIVTPLAFAQPDVPSQDVVSGQREISKRHIEVRLVGSQRAASYEFAQVLGVLQASGQLVWEPKVISAGQSPLQAVSLDGLEGSGADFLSNLCTANRHICKAAISQKGASRQTSDHCAGGVCWRHEAQERQGAPLAGEEMDRARSACRAQASTSRDNGVRDFLARVRYRLPRDIACGPAASIVASEDGLRTASGGLGAMPSLELAYVFGGCKRAHSDRATCASLIEELNGLRPEDIDASVDAFSIDIPARVLTARVRVSNQQEALRALRSYARTLSHTEPSSLGARLDFYAPVNFEPQLQSRGGLSGEDDSAGGYGEASRSGGGSGSLQSGGADQIAFGLDHTTEPHPMKNAVTCDSFGLDADLNILNEKCAFYNYDALKAMNFAFSEFNDLMPNLKTIGGAVFDYWPPISQSNEPHCAFQEGTINPEFKFTTEGVPSDESWKKECGWKVAAHYKKSVASKHHGVMMAGAINGVISDSAGRKAFIGSAARSKVLLVNQAETLSGEVCPNGSCTRYNDFLPLRFINASLAITRNSDNDHEKNGERLYGGRNSNIHNSLIIAAAGNQEKGSGAAWDTLRSCLNYPACWSTEEKRGFRTLSVAGLSLDGTDILRRFDERTEPPGSFFGEMIDVAAVGVGFAPALHVPGYKKKQSGEVSNRNGGDATPLDAASDPSLDLVKYQFLYTYGTSIATAYVSSLTALLAAKFELAYEDYKDKLYDFSQGDFDNCTRLVNLDGHTPTQKKSKNKFRKFPYWLKARIISTADLLDGTGDKLLQVTDRDGKSRDVSQYGRVNFKRALAGEFDLLAVDKGGAKPVMEKAQIYQRNGYRLVVKGGELTTKIWSCNPDNRKECYMNTASGWDTVVDNHDKAEIEIDFSQVLRIRRTDKGARVVYIEQGHGHIVQVLGAQLALKSGGSSRTTVSVKIGSGAPERREFDKIMDYTSRMFSPACSVI